MKEKGKLIESPQQTRLTVEQAAIEIGSGFCAELQRHGFMTPGTESKRMIDAIAAVIRRAELKEAESPRQPSADTPIGEDFTGYSVHSNESGWLISLADFMADWIRRYGVAPKPPKERGLVTDEAIELREFSQHPEPAPVLRCWKCNGTLIYKRTEEGFTVCTCSCKGGHPEPSKGGKQWLSENAPARS